MEPKNISLGETEKKHLVSLGYKTLPWNQITFKQYQNLVDLEEKKRRKVKISALKKMRKKRRKKKKELQIRSQYLETNEKENREVTLQQSKLLWKLGYKCELKGMTALEADKLIGQLREERDIANHRCRMGASSAKKGPPITAAQKQKLAQLGIKGDFPGCTRRVANEIIRFYTGDIASEKDIQYEKKEYIAHRMKKYSIYLTPLWSKHK